MYDLIQVFRFNFNLIYVFAGGRNFGQTKGSPPARIQQLSNGQGTLYRFSDMYLLFAY